MKVDEIKVCILRMEGTNCEQETYDAFKRLGASPEFVHLKQLEGRDTLDGERRSLQDFHILMFPGGFSAGDYIRAGAIFAARLKASVAGDLVRFIDEGKAIGGFCNGFQLMVELGILPAFDCTMAAQPQAVLHANDSGRFECRPTVLKHVNEGKCVWTSGSKKGELRYIPCAHAEGKFMLPHESQEKEDALYHRLFDEDRVVFQFSDPSGDTSAQYPFNPNGSRFNIAGITNDLGTVFGMMPHPERVFFRNTHPDWYRRRIGSEEGDGRAIFRSVLDYVVRKF
ncbi:MAG: phosphoribosylformylglycinamidine synthase subunit PurQ [Candidatus Thermoplasmatota archaeon]|nr:phosphoribosylformylglycinamidine synthase subunit PurQ [Candidatus Thermoplasmatota archaeon]